MFLRGIAILASTLYLLLPSAFAAKVSEYLPSSHSYSNEIVTPEQYLGFGIGERHVRHDQLLNYLKEITTQSPRLSLTSMGHTTEFREQILLTISSQKNLKNVDEIINNRKFGKVPAEDDPIVIWLGYSVHGDEISGANAALVVAYYLAASEHEDVTSMLDDVVIVIEPSINPDGMDRFVNWVSTHRGITPNADPNHIEHHQMWRTGRTNHFGFDLNRDWLLLSQQETRNRMKYFHQYSPNVLGDFHEMGANSSYFFQPGIPSRTHPLTPANNTSLTQLIATYHAKALDKENRLYYSEESFDDFYYGKGSTYPDINGGIGILFEQASSRGYQQETVNGLLTFEYGIKNHVLTSISTIEGSWKNADAFKKYKANFVEDNRKLAKNSNIEGYVFSAPKDDYRLSLFLTRLSQHNINAFALRDNFELNDREYRKAQSYYVPLNQPQYRVIQALFNQLTNFKDNTFYDVSGWTLPLAMNISFEPVQRTRGLKLAKTPWKESSKSTINVDQDAYAYVIEWHEFMAPKLLNTLLNSGIRAKVATKPFTSSVFDNTKAEAKTFKTGSIVIPAGIQSNENWREILTQASVNSGVNVFSLTTGLTKQGIDIGSSSLRSLSPIKPLVIGGKGVSQYEAAEVLFYLDNMLNIPTTVVEKARLSRINFDQYTHILLVDGQYNDLSESIVERIKTWVKKGGVVFGQKRGAKWLASHEILKVNFVSRKHIDQLFDIEELTYQDKEKLSARKRIAGAIYEAKVDLTHPLAYGYNTPLVPVFKNSTLIMDLPSSPFVTVAQYTQSPLLSGYTDNHLVNRIANNASIVAHNYGRGRAIGTTDNLAFRGYWLGSMKFLANSLFFSKAFSAELTLNKR